ncbi:MAG: hypothetical protein EOM37_05435 [Proteobacteria bacterium]|nr:hypothetical protein [Pseudomonadota bacterium]
MLDFETFYKNHGENFIWDILHIWERDNRMGHPCSMTLEERWDRFLRSTDDRQATFRSTATSAAIN